MKRDLKGFKCMTVRFETFRDLLKLFETFKPKKLHEFDEVFHGKYEIS